MVTTSVRSLEAVAQLHGGALAPHVGPVNLVIMPGYRFAVVQGLLTNFHLPKSSLLLLVSALIGRQRLLDLYTEAMARNYRFFSCSDAMWIAPEAVLDTDLHPEAQRDEPSVAMTRPNADESGSFACPGRPLPLTLKPSHDQEGAVGFLRDEGSVGGVSASKCEDELC